jgi:hypothetical protein
MPQIQPPVGSLSLMQQAAALEAKLINLHRQQHALDTNARAQRRARPTSALRAVDEATKRAVPAAVAKLEQDTYPRSLKTYIECSSHGRKGLLLPPQQEPPSATSKVVPALLMPAMPEWWLQPSDANADDDVHWRDDEPTTFTVPVVASAQQRPASATAQRIEQRQPQQQRQRPASAKTALSWDVQTGRPRRCNSSSNSKALSSGAAAAARVAAAQALAAEAAAAAAQKAAKPYNWPSTSVARSVQRFCSQVQYDW